MHFPFAMAINGQTLLLSSQDSDGKYDYGRLVAFDTKEIKQDIKNLSQKWEQLVKSNVLIPPDIGLISFEDYIIFASRADNRLYLTPKPLCNEPFEVISKCPDTATLDLGHNDPYALAVLEKKTERDIILASYLSSGHLDLIEYNKKPKKPALKALKSLNIQDWLGEKYKGDFFTKKVSVAQANLYILVERKPSKEFIDDLTKRKVSFKLATLRKNTGALLLKIKVDDLLNKNKITDADIKIFNLQEDFGISLAQDFYIDKNDEIAVILARSPESLIKIKLDSEKILDTQLLCRGASLMAVSQDLDRIVVPCFSDNRVISLTLSSLAIVAASDFHGRGPAFALIDEDHKKVFVSFNIEGKVGVFDFDLKYLGELFEPAPRNRVGS